MGVDLSAMFGDAKAQAEKGMNDLLKQGGNAGLGYLEQQAINVIQADKTQHDEAAKQAIADSLASPQNPNGFGAYLSNLASGPAVKQYGPYIMGAVGIALFVGFFLKGK